MEVAKYVLVAVYSIVCLVLIVLALMQSKDDEGLSGTITGSSSSNFLEKNKGRTKQGKLKKWTIILGVVFLILTIALNIIYIV